jgi:IrrE N-terminal-like domain
MIRSIGATTLSGDPSSKGRQTARLFRQYRVPDATQRTLNLEATCAEDDLEIFEFRSTTPGCTACLLRAPGPKGGGILLAPDQEPGRRRFSIAHEMGHYHIPAHRGAESGLGWCGDVEMRATSLVSKLEWEANDFASELLMPSKLFGEDVALRDISIRSAMALASDNFYSVSVTASAWRMVQLASDSCALVVSSESKIDWVIRSESFRIPGLRNGDRVSDNSFAADAFATTVGKPSPQEVDLFAWLAPQYPVRGRLLESTHVIRSTEQVLSLLWLVPE